MDSYGHTIPSQIQKFINTVIQQTVEKEEEYTFIENKKRHQYSSSECGMYCLYVIINLLKGKSFKQLAEKRIPDKKMIYLRKKYFNHKIT